MCSPSRATLLTGRYPAQHGVTLTHTQADLRPDPRNLPAVTATLARHPASARGAAPAGAARVRPRACCSSGRSRATSPSCSRALPNLASCSARPGMRSPTRASGTSPTPAGTRLAARRLGAIRRGSARRDYGFADWEPPDAGENAKAEHFGAGNAGPLGAGLGRALHAADRALARACRPAGALLPRRLARQPARRARLPGPVRGRWLHAIGVPRPRRAAASDRSSRTCATSPPCTS